MVSSRVFWGGVVVLRLEDWFGDAAILMEDLHLQSLRCGVSAGCPRFGVVC
jgi:hypothetical protein